MDRALSLYLVLNASHTPSHPRPARPQGSAGTPSTPGEMKILTTGSWTLTQQSKGIRATVMEEGPGDPSVAGLWELWRVRDQSGWLAGWLRRALGTLRAKARATS